MANVGSTDRVIRLVLGAVLLLAPFVPPLASVFAAWGAWKFLVAVAGLILLATGITRFCPLYTLFGLRT